MSAMMESGGMISGSGVPDENVTCESFYESVISAVDILNDASLDTTRSLSTLTYLLTLIHSRFILTGCAVAPALC